MQDASYLFLELPTRIELVTPALPWLCSTYWAMKAYWRRLYLLCSIYYISYCFFSYSFNWEFLNFSVSMNLGENYPLWSWRALFMWEHPCVDCVSPVFLVQRLFSQFAVHYSGCDWYGIQSLHWMLGRAACLLHGCHSLVRRQGPLPSCWSRRPMGWVS